jgi:hypothetical protein
VLPTETLLARLDAVHQTGPGRWIARCPAHDDRHPSLALRESDGGRLLIYCRALCAAHDVLAAVGLSLADLYPRGAVGDHPRERRPWSAYDVLACVAHESIVVTLAASALARGEALSDGRRERLLLAAERLQRAVEIANA